MTDAERHEKERIKLTDADSDKVCTVYSKDLYIDGERFFPACEEHGQYLVKIIRRIEE